MKRLSTVAAAVVGLVGLTSQASAGTFTLSNVTPGIFDASSGTRSVTVTGAELGFDTGILIGLTIAIDYMKADGEGPTPGPGTPFYNEIHFRLDRAGDPSTTLIAPGTYAVGAPGSVFSGIQVFDDGGVLIVPGSTPTVGTFAPTGPGTLGAYAGTSALGVWTLFIEDTVGLDALRFSSVSFTFETQAVPEPVSALLVGSGLLAAAYRRRRKTV